MRSAVNAFIAWWEALQPEEREKQVGTIEVHVRRYAPNFQSYQDLELDAVLITCMNNDIVIFIMNEQRDLEQVTLRRVHDIITNVKRSC